MNEGMAPEAVGRMVDLYFNKGWSLRQVAEELHCDRNTVANHLKKLGYKLRTLQQANRTYSERRQRAIIAALPPIQPTLEDGAR